MKSSIVPDDSGNSIGAYIHPSVPISEGFDSLFLDEESSIVPPHPLGLKPCGNQYTATRNARHGVGGFQLLPDEVLALFLEYLDSRELRLLGSTCTFLYAFCVYDDLWKTLFIE
jgi:hypothetical protein